MSGNHCSLGGWEGKWGQLVLPGGPRVAPGFHIGSFLGPAGRRTPAPLGAGDPDAEERSGDLAAPEGEGGPEETTEDPPQKQRHRNIFLFHQDGEPSVRGLREP